MLQRAHARAMKRVDKLPEGCSRRDFGELAILLGQVSREYHLMAREVAIAAGLG